MSAKPSSRSANHGSKALNHDSKALNHGSKPAKVAKLAKLWWQFCQSVVSCSIFASQHSSCPIC